MNPIKIKSLFFVMAFALLASQAVAQNYWRTMNEKTENLLNLMELTLKENMLLLELLTPERVAQYDDARKLRQEMLQFGRDLHNFYEKMHNEWHSQYSRHSPNVHVYNAWVNWYNDKNRGIKNFADFALKQNFGSRVLEIVARDTKNQMLKVQVKEYVLLIMRRINDIVTLQKTIANDPIMQEVNQSGYNLDAREEIANAYMTFTNYLNREAESLEALLNRFRSTFETNGFDASINVLLNHFNYSGARPPTPDEARRFVNTKLQPQHFGRPNVSEPLARYRKASSILDYLAEMLERIQAFQPTISILDESLATMTRMANILEKLPEDRGPLDRFSQELAVYLAHLQSIPDLKALKRPNDDVFVAAKLIAAEANLKSYFGRFGRLHDDLTGRVFRDVNALRSQLANEYLIWLKADINSNIVRLRDFEAHLLEGNVVSGFDDTDALLAALQAQLQAEQNGLKLVNEAMSREKTHTVRTFEEWAASFRHLPFADGDGSRLFWIVDYVLNFDELPSTDPSLYLARCELALTLFPGNVPIRHEKAHQLNRLGRYGEAEVIMLDLHTAEPARQDLAITLAASYEGQGNTDAAEALLRNVMADTQYVELYMLNEWLRFAHRQGQLAGALKGWEEIFAVRAEQEAFYRMLMYVHTYAGDFRAATLAFESLPEGTKTSEDWEHYVHLGLSSEDIYKRAMLAASEDKSPLAHQVSMAFVRIGQGRTEEAGELLDAIGLDNTPWYLLIPWIHFADITESDDLSRRIDTKINAIEDKDARELMRALRLVARGESDAAAMLLEPFYWSPYPYLHFLQARAAFGQGNSDTALSILDKLDKEVGFDFAPAITMKYQLQVLTGNRAETRRTLDRLDGVHAPDCPILAFYHCLYETRFGSRRKAMRLKKQVLDAYPDGLAGVSNVLHITAESIEIFDRAGVITAKVWTFTAAGLLLAGGLLFFGLLRPARSQKKRAA